VISHNLKPGHIIAVVSSVKITTCYTVILSLTDKTSFGQTNIGNEFLQELGHYHVHKLVLQLTAGPQKTHVLRVLWVTTSAVDPGAQPF